MKSKVVPASFEGIGHPDYQFGDICKRGYLPSHDTSFPVDYGPILEVDEDELEKMAAGGIFLVEVDKSGTFKMICQLGQSLGNKVQGSSCVEVDGIR